MKKIEKRLKRKTRIRSKVFGTGLRPRLSVFRSNRHIFAQVIDDDKGITVLSVNDTDLNKVESAKKTKKMQAGLLGEILAKKAQSKNIKQVTFDRNGFRYHGRIKEFADGVRKGGLNV